MTGKQNFTPLPLGSKVRFISTIPDDGLFYVRAPNYPVQAAAYRRWPIIPMTENHLDCDCIICEGEHGAATLARNLNVLPVIGTQWDEPRFTRHRSKRLWKKLRRRSAKPLHGKPQILVLKG